MIMDNYNNQGYNQNYNTNQNNYQNPNNNFNYPQGQPVNPPVYGKTQPVTGWNWGACMYGWIWGLANGTWMPLLGILPILNMFWWIVCGIKGNEWALNSGMWKTVEEFNAVQKSWNRAGKVMFWVTFIFLVIYFVLIFGVIGIGVFSEVMNELSYY